MSSMYGRIAVPAARLLSASGGAGVPDRQADQVDIVATSSEGV